MFVPEFRKAAETARRLGQGDAIIPEFTRTANGMYFAKPVVALFLLLAAQGVPAAELQPKTLGAWERYAHLTDQRVAKELADKERFLATDFLKANPTGSIRSQLRNGQVHIQKMQTLDASGREIPVEDGMIHHWIGVIYVPGVSLDALIRWVQDYDRHQEYFQEVEQSKLLSRDGDEFKIFLRLRRKKVITVYYNTYHTAVYRHHDARRVSSYSYTTKIAELDHSGTAQEAEKPVGKDSGFLWRLNSHWRFQEADGGVFVECESFSLSRAIPWGFGWIVKSFVESVPRESLENTLTAIRRGVQQKAQLDSLTIETQRSVSRRDLTLRTLGLLPTERKRIPQ